MRKTTAGGGPDVYEVTLNPLLDPATTTVKLTTAAAGGTVFAPGPGGDTFLVIPDAPGGDVTFGYAATDAASGFSSDLTVDVLPAAGLSLTEGLFHAAGATAALRVVQDPAGAPQSLAVRFKGDADDVALAEEWYDDMYDRAPPSVTDYLDGVEDRGGVDIDVVNGDGGVFFGSYDDGSIDLDDIDELDVPGLTDGLTRDFVMLWEVMEQDIKENQPPPPGSSNPGPDHDRDHKRTSRAMELLVPDVRIERKRDPTAGGDKAIPTGPNEVMYVFVYFYKPLPGTDGKKKRVTDYIYVGRTTGEVLRVESRPKVWP